MFDEQKAASETVYHEHEKYNLTSKEPDKLSYIEIV